MAKTTKPAAVRPADARRLIRRFACITLTLLVALSLLASDASLFGSTVGRTLRSLVGWNASRAYAVGTTRYEWKGTKPPTLSVGGDTIIVAAWSLTASSGLLFSWQHDGTVRLWVEDNAPDGTSTRHEDLETLTRAIEFVNRTRTPPLPIAAATSVVRTRMTNWLGVAGDALAVSSLVYLCVSFPRRGT